MIYKDTLSTKPPHQLSSFLALSILAPAIG
jgi:hypothetical protein